MFATAANAAVLEEVVVTAQKREQSLQDVGISVSAFSGEQMDALGVTNATEIIQQIPGLQVSEFSPALTTFNIRGVSQANFQDHLEAPVAVFVDDVYISSMNAISGQLFDVKRVEVLRGPQGTLFGRNATGGLIHYVSRPADEEELNGYGEVGYGNYNTKHVEIAVGAALSDTVRGRFSARTEKGDGYIEATQPGVEDIHSKDSLALRGALLVEFSDDLTGDFFLKYAKSDLDTGAYVNTGNLLSNGLFEVNSQNQAIEGSAFDPYQFSSGTRGFLDRENISTSAKFDWDMNEHVNVVSITGYLSMDKNYLEDGDGSAQGLAIVFNPDTEFSQFTQEIRFSGETDGMRWQTGLFYMDTKTETDSLFTGGPLINLLSPTFPVGPPTFGLGIDPYSIGLPANDVTAYSPNTQLFERAVVDSENWSIFGQAEFDLGDELTLIVGLRWSEDEKEIDYTSRFTDLGVAPGDTSWLGAFLGAPIPFFGTPFDLKGVSRDDEIDYEDWAGRVQLDWRVTDETLLFASWNRGIKGGNWNANLVPYISLTNPSVPFQHPEEVLNSYELGIKTELNDWARLNATIFYYDYQDYQGFSVAGLVPQIQSSDASNKGGEIELFLTPGEHWDIVLGLSLLDSEVDQVSGPPSSNFAPSIFSDVAFPQAPEWSINYLFRYNWDALNGNIALQLDGLYEDEQFLEIQNGPASLQEKSGLVNARATYTTGDGAWEVTAWIKNIEDKARKVYALDLGANGGSTAQFGAPQTFGLTVKRNFGAF